MKNLIKSRFKKALDKIVKKEYTSIKNRLLSLKRSGL